MSPRSLGEEVTIVMESQDVNELSGEDSQMDCADTYSMIEVQNQGNLFDSQPQNPNPCPALALGNESTVSAGDSDLSFKQKCSSIPSKKHGTGTTLVMFEVKSQDNLLVSLEVSRQQPVPAQPQSQQGNMSQPQKTVKSSSLQIKKDRSRSRIRYPLGTHGWYKDDSNFCRGGTVAFSLL